MSNRVMKKKIPYVDQFESIEDAFNYLAKELNAARTNNASSALTDSNSADYTGMPVGSVVHSMLTLSQFQAQAGSGWVLSDGSSCSGTSYEAITGFSNLPDMRGRFLRAKSHGSGNNPDGDLSLGAYSSDKLGSHSHNLIQNTTASLSLNGGSTAYWTPQSGGSSTGGIVVSSGSNETAPKSITVNIFIRIN